MSADVARDQERIIGMFKPHLAPASGGWWIAESGRCTAAHSVRMYPSLRTAIEGERSRRELVKMQVKMAARRWAEEGRRLATIVAPKRLY